MESNQYSSVLQREGFCHFVISGGFALHSPTLAAMGLSGEYRGFRIEEGSLLLGQPVRWLSPLMETHDALVFLGLSSVGKFSLDFRYGKPWCYKACPIRYLLSAHRSEIAVSRRQAATVFTEELKAVSFPLARAVGSIAGAFLPRGGWQVT